jgi:hypothetical protein
MQSSTLMPLNPQPPHPQENVHYGVIDASTFPIDADFIERNPPWARHRFYLRLFFLISGGAIGGLIGHVIDTNHLNPFINLPFNHKFTIGCAITGGVTAFLIDNYYNSFLIIRNNPELYRSYSRFVSYWGGSLIQ